MDDAGCICRGSASRRSKGRYGAPSRAAPRRAIGSKRTPVTPNPDKVVVPPGYKVGVFKAGLDTPSSAAVDKDGNLWVAISGQLFNTIDHARSAARQDFRQETET